MLNKHFVIIIPGLGDESNIISWVTNHWRKHDLEPIVYSINWHDGKTFQIKLDLLVKIIDKLSKNRESISIVGCSAGGSAAMNAFIKRKDKIHRVINVCGRLRRGDKRGFRSFESRTASSQPFAQSVKLFERNEKLLSDKDRYRVMTIRALFGDELVPAETTILHGAYNTAIPTPEHIFSIIMALTVFSRHLISFLKKEIN